MGHIEFSAAGPQRRTPPPRPVEPRVQYPPEDGGVGAPMSIGAAVAVALTLGAYFMGWIK